MSKDSDNQNCSRVLVVDDTPTNLAVLKETLTPEGYKLAFANTGEKAIEIATKMLPELILLDIMMPGIDGLETCRQLKKDSKTREIRSFLSPQKKKLKILLKGFAPGEWII